MRGDGNNNTGGGGGGGQGGGGRSGNPLEGGEDSPLLLMLLDPSPTTTTAAAATTLRDNSGGAAAVAAAIAGEKGNPRQNDLDADLDLDDGMGDAAARARSQSDACLLPLGGQQQMQQPDGSVAAFRRHASSSSSSVEMTTGGVHHHHHHPSHHHRLRASRNRRSSTASAASSTTATTTPSRASSQRTSSSSAATATGTSSSTSADNSSSLRPPSGGGGGGGLRASLDAGMAAVKGWIRSRSNNRNNNRGSAALSRSSHSLRRGGHRPQSIRSASLGEEDLFALSMTGRDPRSSPARRPHPTTIVEEDDSYYADDLHDDDDDDDSNDEEEEYNRQRSYSEPNVSLPFSSHSMRRRRRRSPNQSHSQSPRRQPRNANRGRSYSTPTVLEGEAMGQRPLLSSSAAAALHTNPLEISTADVTSSASSSISIHNSSTNRGERDANSDPALTADAIPAISASFPNDNSNDDNRPQRPPSPPVRDADRQARLRWLQINRRFQLVITIVALVFSLLLFTILLTWVVLTSTYLVSFEKACDVPLGTYFWLVTFQLVLDVFRTDVLRCIFRWDSNSRDRVPVRVVMYNIAYLIYASLVLRLGVTSVFVEKDATCRDTAPELFNASKAFVSLSLAAWGTILFGYVLPLCVVAGLLTYNGFNPALENVDGEGRAGPTNPVFPSAFNGGGAARYADLLPTVTMNDLSEDVECCICMEEFEQADRIVKTACSHVFHKECCREWLRQARTCPVCRADIPSMLQAPDGGVMVSTTGAAATPAAGNSYYDDTPAPDARNRIPVGPTGRPVAGLLRILQSVDQRQREGRRSPPATITTTTSSTPAAVPEASQLSARSRASSANPTSSSADSISDLDLESGFAAANSNVLSLGGAGR